MKKSAGLSLIETLLAVGISLVVGTLLVVIMINSAGLHYRQSSKLEEGLNINDALSGIRQNIREAYGVALSYTYDLTTYTSSDSQLVLKVTSVDSMGNLITDTFDYYVFFKDQDKLRFKTFPNGASARKARNQIFSASVDGLKFQYLDSAFPPNEVAPLTASKVRITLSLKQKSGSYFETTIATSEAALRND